MIDMSSAEVDFSLEAELQAIRLDDERLDEYDDKDDIVLNDIRPETCHLDGLVSDVELSPLVNDYLNSLAAQSQHLEEKLQECDELLLYQSQTASKAVVSYEEYKPLEEFAAEQGMTVDEFRQKVLQEAQTNDFTEEVMAKEYAELTQLQTELSQLRTWMMDTREKEGIENVQTLELSNQTGDISQASCTNGQETEDSVALSFISASSLPSSHTEVNPGLSTVAVLSSMRDYIHEQLKRTEEDYQVKRQKLMQSLESHRQEEEKNMLEQENRRQKLQQQLQEEEAAMMKRNREQEKVLEEVMRVRDEEIKEDLSLHQAEIDKLSQDLEEEKHQYEQSCKEWMERLKVTRHKAATQIQRMYRGHRSRGQQVSIVQELVAWRLLRKAEEKQRLKEYEIKYREQQAQKEKEEQARQEAEERKEIERQEEMERRKKEEEKRQAEERRTEERREEKEKLEKEKRKKEAENREKEAELQRKEEEKRQKEEEKKKQKEEDRLKKEAENRKKEAELQRKEEEKRQKEEERQKKEAENREKEVELHRKEEEKRQKEEERQKKEAENREKVELQRKEEKKQKEEKKRQKEEEEEEDRQKKEAENREKEEEKRNKEEESEQRIKEENSGEGMKEEERKKEKERWRLEDRREVVTGRAEVAASNCCTGQPTSLASSTTPDTVRLAWIKDCLPWSKVSNEPWKLTQVTHKHYKKCGQLKKLPAVTEQVVLAAAQADTLRQVSTLKLTDLPGCSLSTLAHCWSLRYLTVTNCGLVCLEGLGQCKHLLYIDAAKNNIEYIDLKDLGSVQVVKLSYNHLNVIHGLEGCINLRWLDLSSNRISKLTGLSSVRRLHTLDVSNNQVVSSQGLNEVVTLQHLNLSQNYLQHFTGVDKLCLLTHLNLSSNNLLQVPELKNQVLLQVLELQENSIKSLSSFGTTWLPLLSQLNCAQNMLESIENIGQLIMLSHLDISFNQITDLEPLTTNLSQMKRLETAMLKGNPLVDVYQKEYKISLAKALPSLKWIDEEQLTQIPEAVLIKTNEDKVDFLAMCMSQIKLQGHLRREFETQMKVLLTNPFVTSETVCATYFSYCNTSFSMATEHRAAHEYGVVCTALPQSSVHLTSKFVSPGFLSEAAANGLKPQSKAVLNSDSASVSKTDTYVPCSYSTTSSSLVSVTPYSSISVTDRTSSSLAELGRTRKPLSHCDPVNSQQADLVNTYSGFGVNLGQESVETPEEKAEETGNSLLPLSHTVSSYMSEKDKFEVALTEKLQKRKCDGSDMSPSVKHYLMSGANNLAEVAVQNETGSTSLAFLVKKRVNSGSSVMAQEISFSGHRPLTDVKADVAARLDAKADSAVRPLPGVKADVVVKQLKRDELFDESQLADLNLEDFDLDQFLAIDQLEKFLEQDWRPTDSPQNSLSPYPVLGQVNTSSKRMPPSLPSQAWQDSELRGKHAQLSSPMSVETLGAAGSVRSKKEELIEEWGFKDPSTAKWIMARAKKMKYNAERKRKLKKLSPQQRLQLLKKLEEAYKVKPVKAPASKILPRKEYFQAQEEQLWTQEVERCADTHQRTFHWLHTHPISSSRINPRAGSTHTNSVSRHQPSVEHHYLRNTSPLSDHLESVSITNSGDQFRRYSVGDGHSGHILPPIQTGLISCPKKERISFRDNPVKKSGGWGGGHRRSQRK